MYFALGSLEKLSEPSYFDLDYAFNEIRSNFSASFCTYHSIFFFLFRSFDFDFKEVRNKDQITFASHISSFNLTKCNC